MSISDERLAGLILEVERRDRLKLCEALEDRDITMALRELQQWRTGAMNKDQVAEILKDAIGPNASLKTLNAYQFIRFEPGDRAVKLDGDFEPEELEALAWWIRNHQD